MIRWKESNDHIEKISEKRIMGSGFKYSLFWIYSLNLFPYILWIFILFTFLFLLFYLLFQFHWLSATVHIADTACRAAIICALIYHFKFKPAYLTNKSLASLKFIAIHSYHPDIPEEKLCNSGSNYL
jgi:hypothetical protein